MSTPLSYPVIVFYPTVPMVGRKIEFASGTPLPRIGETMRFKHEGKNRAFEIRDIQWDLGDEDVDSINIYLELKA